jgi:hypothetical protein
MCKVLNVYRSSYYQYLNKHPSARELENKSIMKSIIDIYKSSKNRYVAHKINGPGLILVHGSMMSTQSFMKLVQRIPLVLVQELLSLWRYH